MSVNIVENQLYLLLTIGRENSAPENVVFYGGIRTPIHLARKLSIPSLVLLAKSHSLSTVKASENTAVISAT